MADKKSASSPDRPDINPDDENVTLTEGELDNLFGGAEVSEVSLESAVDDELPSVEDGIPVDSDVASDELDELPSLDLPSVEQDADGIAEEPELPSLDLETEDLDAQEASDLPELPSLDDDLDAGKLEDEIPEDLPTPEEVKDIELPDLSSEPSADEPVSVQAAVLENANPADELPSLDDMDLPDLSNEAGGKDGEENEEVEIIDGEASSGAPRSASAGREEEDETIALSNSELDNILSDVDETQVLDLEAGEDEVVSVSGEELDSITQDLEPVPSEDESAPLEGRAASEKDVMADSMNFEAEIMEDAQVQIPKLDDEPEALPDEDDAGAEEGIATAGTGFPTEAVSRADADTLSQPTQPSATQTKEPETAFDEIHAIPAPPDSIEDETGIDPGDDAIPEETLEAIDLDEVHQATRPPDSTVSQPDSGAWDGRITATDIAEAEAKSPTKAADPIASRPARAARVEDRELYDLLKYLETLLEKLPEANIREFAESRYYDRYIALVNRLGI
jgi:hypothetical protein